MTNDWPNESRVIPGEARDLAIEAATTDRLKRDPSAHGRSLAVFATRDDRKVCLGRKHRSPRGSVLFDPI